MRTGQGLVAATSAAHRRKPRGARELLPVCVAIGMWLTQALIGPLYLALPGVSQRHATAVWICSAVALCWAVMNALIPSDPRLGFLYPVGGAMAIASVAVLLPVLALSPTGVMRSWWEPGRTCLAGALRRRGRQGLVRAAQDRTPNVVGFVRNSAGDRG